MADLTPEGSFAAWLRKEVPPGTDIGNPDWWAPLIWRAVERVRSHPDYRPANTGGADAKA